MSTPEQRAKYLKSIMDNYGPVLKTEYCVSEYLPPDHDSDGYRVKEQNILKENWTTDFEKITSFIAKNVPQQGAEFKINTRYLREHTTKKWVTF